MFRTFFSDDESTDVTMDDVVVDSAVDDSLDPTIGTAIPIKRVERLMKIF
jgi:hypothetical protein